MGWNIEGTLIEKDWEAEKVPARAARDCSEKELVCIARVGVTIIRIRFGCNQITEIST